MLIGALLPGGCDTRSADQTTIADTAAAVRPAPTTGAALLSETSIDRNLLKGGWSPDGDTFVMAVEDSTILYEFDMKNHPYMLKGDTIIVDFQDPTLGVQKKLVLRLTADTLVIKDVEYDASETLIRVKQ